MQDQVEQMNAKGIKSMMLTNNSQALEYPAWTIVSIWRFQTAVQLTRKSFCLKEFLDDESKN